MSRRVTMVQNVFVVLNYYWLLGSRTVTYCWTWWSFTVIKNEKWLEWFTKMPQHTSLADIWRWLKRVGGKYSASQPIHPSPDQEAEWLVNMFSARTSSQNLSANSQILLEWLTPVRWLEINQACMREDEADVQYTLMELRNSYKKGKDTAPGWDKITQW